MLLLVDGTLQGGTVLVACVPEGAGTCLVPREDKLQVGDCRMDVIQADNVLLLQRVSVHVCVPKIHKYRCLLINLTLSTSGLTAAQYL